MTDTSTSRGVSTKEEGNLSSVGQIVSFLKAPPLLAVSNEQGRQQVVSRYLAVHLCVHHHPVHIVVKDITVGAGGLGFNFRVGQFGRCRQLRRVAETLSLGDGPRHSLYASM